MSILQNLFSFGKKRTLWHLMVAVVVSVGFVWPIDASGQYFGRNKPRYGAFDFRVLQTDHFEVYHYLQDSELPVELATSMEQWYAHHLHILHDTFTRLNPVLLYSNHADFQQTNAVSGIFGPGTGGVTEALKNRVVMPLAMSRRQTDHVLGHELVHAFQYNMILRGDSTTAGSLQNLPLWMVEGLAEYLSIGRIDPHTAIWMRDAVLRDDVPNLRRLSHPDYFPYRWGQVFWAFLTSLYGDEVIEPFFMSTARNGLDEAIRLELGLEPDTLSDVWVKAIQEYYGPMVRDESRTLIEGTALLEELPGRIAVSPRISPDGKYVIFLSERDLFGLDLFLADVSSEQVIRKVFSTTRDGHIDEYHSIESAGAWSPDSRQFVTVAFVGGKNALIFKDVQNGKTVRELAIPGVPAFANPAWSPDGNKIVVSGMVEGQVDLYEFHLKDGSVRKLTDNRASEMQAEFYSDGEKLVYSTDEMSALRGGPVDQQTFNIAVLQIGTGEVTHYDPFPGSDQLNPLFDSEGRILFLSDRDGYRDLYQLDPATGRVWQMSRLKTGISGITHEAPAMSIGQFRNRDRLVYSMHRDGGYDLIKVYLDQLFREEVEPGELNWGPATLPKESRTGWEVTQSLVARNQLYPVDSSAWQHRAYKPKFRLDYIGGGTGLGIGSNSLFGTQAGMAGGIDMLFGDILGNQQMYAGLNINGQVYDFGGQVAWLNRKKPLIWGASISHIPYRSGYYLPLQYDTVLIEGEPVEAVNLPTNLIRMFENRAAVFGQRAFSRTLRVEAGASYARYNYRVERFNNYYTSDGAFFLGSTREVEDPPPGSSLSSINAALVSDNSWFGLASPLEGYRYRLGVEQFFGYWNFYQLTADFRRYVYMRPVSLAVRALHIGRYGRDADQLLPYYLGSQSLVHGYTVLSVSEQGENGITFEELTGSRLLVANAEIRLPLSGPGQMAMIPSNVFFTELSIFLDGGVAYDRFGDITLKPEANGPAPHPIFTTGVALRINLFGALVLEPYYAWQLRNNGRRVFALNIVPGW
ncbi:MAG: hypothetical protein ACO4CH_05345 [Saprospiraceae bacterium]